MIKGFISSTSLTSDGAEIYIEKDTGLFVKMIEQKIGVVTKREYDFNQVEDLIFEQPDIIIM